MSALFSLEQISVSYGHTQVLKSIDLSMEAGEFCALLGLNGCGKTTLLRAACGLLPCTGTCAVAGRDATRLNERERAKLISFIPQVQRLIGGKSVLDVVLMGYNPHLALLESPGAQHCKTALSTLEKLGYGDYAEKDFGTLSQGQKQMVVFARSLVQNAPVMLMDEPDSALDFLNKHRVLEKIRTIIHSENKAGLITLHDPNFAMSYCDRLFLMKDGALAASLHMADAPLSEVREKLSIVYGDIQVQRFGSHYMMGKE